MYWLLTFSQNFDVENRSHSNPDCRSLLSRIHWLVMNSENGEPQSISEPIRNYLQSAVDVMLQDLREIHWCVPILEWNAAGRLTGSQRAHPLDAVEEKDRVLGAYSSHDGADCATSRKCVAAYQHFAQRTLDARIRSPASPRTPRGFEGLLSLAIEPVRTRERMGRA